jgi:SSS family solute:Na+ symporter
MIYAITIALYIGILVYVGARKARSVKNQEDFALAGRKLSTFVLVGTLLATWIGTGSIFGNTEETYKVGLAAFIIPLGSVLGIIALTLLANRIRHTGQLTIQDLLEIRYGVTARILGTITLLLAYIIIVSYQYRAGAAVIEQLLPESILANPWTSYFVVIGVALIVIIYTALAGMYSVAYTDVANGILMTIGIIVALCFTFTQVGGFTGLRETLPESHQQFWGVYTISDYIGIFLPTFLLMLGDANIYSRFFSAREPKSARQSALWLLVGVGVLECAIIALAYTGRALHPEIDNPAHIVVHIAFYSLPSFLGAILVATIVAVIISTADSYLLAPSSAIVRDVYHRFINKNADGKTLVLMSRVIVCVFGIIAIGLAFMSDKFFKISLFAYTIYGVGITPCLIAVFTWKRANNAGAISSIISGVTIAILWKVFALDAVDWSSYGLPLTSLDPVIPSFLISVLVLVFVSFVTAPPKEESWKPFFQQNV